MKTIFNCTHTVSTRIRTAGLARKNHQQGFTLIEILVAIFILAIVTSLVMGSFDRIFSDADYINTGTDLHEMGSACLNRIALDLKSIHVTSYPQYTPPGIDDEPEIHRVKGETRNTGGQTFGWLRFTSLAHLAFNQDIQEGIAEIVYYVQQTPDNVFILRRADRLYPYPEEFEEREADPVLCEQLRSFEIIYYDAEGHEFEEWDSESDEMDYSTPRAIGVKFSIGTEETHFVFSSQFTLPAYRYRKVRR